MSTSWGEKYGTIGTKLSQNTETSRFPFSTKHACVVEELKFSEVKKNTVSCIQNVNTYMIIRILEL